MKRILSWAFFCVLLAGCGLALLLASRPIALWWDSAFSGAEAARGLLHLPLLPAGLAALWGWHLGQGKVTALAFVLVAAHAFTRFPFFLVPLATLHDGLALTLPWAFPLLLHLPESGLRKPWAWVRIGVAAVILWLALFWASHRGLGIHWPLPMSELSGWDPILSAFLALLLVWLIPGAGGRDLRTSWTFGLICVGVALTQGRDGWPAEVRAAVWPVFFGLSTIPLLGGLYGLTWRRAYLDELTGLPGRRAFEEAVRSLGRRYTIAMLDVDHFKRVNDQHGHPVGDQLLRFIATRLRRLPYGRAFRYGGEEFALLIPAKGVEGVLPFMENLRASVELASLTLRGKDRPHRKPTRRGRPAGGKDQVRVTVSIGVAQRDRTHTSPQAVLKAADEALYRAKRKGRNRVEWERRKSKR